MSRWLWFCAALLSVPALAGEAQSNVATTPPLPTTVAQNTNTNTASESANPAGASGQELNPAANTPAAAISPEQEKEIEKALQQDTAANAKANAQAAPPGALNQTPASSTGNAPMGAFLQSLNPDISVILDVAAAAFDRPVPTIGEQLVLEAGGHDPSHNGFNLQQLELSLSKSVDPYFRFDSNIVLTQAGIEIEEAYATTLDLPAQLQVRAGKFLTRFGRINATHPHTWDFVDQPFIVSKMFGPEGNRGVGVELSWITPLPWYVELVATAINPEEEDATRSFINPPPDGQPDPFHIRNPEDLEYMFAAKQFFPISDDVSVLWGLSSAIGPNGQTLHSHSLILGTDLYVKYRPLTEGSTTIVSLQAEEFYRRRQTVTDTLIDEGGYAYLFWRFAQRWGTALRYEWGTPSYASGGNGTIADDYLDPDWVATRNRISANVTFWPTEFSRLRFQGQIDNLGATNDNLHWALFLTLEVAVGAHGAHQF